MNERETKTMTEYRVRVEMSNGVTFTLACDMTQAAAGIKANWTGEADGWVSTPYQTADARHDIRRAAKLVNDYSAGSAEDRTATVVSVEDISR